jgi:methionyl-tRNA formyltransferase
MNYIAITSDNLRHREFIERIGKHIQLSHIVVVSKPEGNKQFRASENKFFGDKDFEPVNAKIIQCTKEQLRSKRMKRLLSEINPEICFVFGAPLLKEDLYNIPRRGCVNIHTGLVQHHRGVDSPFWAIDEGRLDTVGATLHFIDNSIDGGQVVAQRNTTGLTIEDNPEDIFMRTCNTGFDILEESIYNILYDSVTACPLEQRGKLYQTKDMSFEKMLEIRCKTPPLLKEYLNGNNS